VFDIVSTRHNQKHSCRYCTHSVHEQQGHQRLWLGQSGRPSSSLPLLVRGVLHSLSNREQNSGWTLQLQWLPQ
jgi:hypothetical protein